MFQSLLFLSYWNTQWALWICKNRYFFSSVEFSWIITHVYFLQTSTICMLNSLCISAISTIFSLTLLLVTWSHFILLVVILLFFKVFSKFYYNLLYREYLLIYTFFLRWTFFSVVSLLRLINSYCITSFFTHFGLEF